MDLPTELFWELASDLRCSILLELHGQSLKPTVLAKKIGQTVQETHRQCDRLEEKGLVKRQAKGQICLTPVGSMVLAQFPYFKFLAKNKKYFEGHGTGSLPAQFVQRLGALEGCELLEGAFAIIERWKRISKEAKEQLRFVSVQVSLDVFKLGVAAARRGAAVSLIHGKNTICPKGSKKELTGSAVQELIERQAYQRRMVDAVDIVVVFNEKEGTVALPDLEGKADVGYTFAGAGPQFLGWCGDYFDYMWGRASRWDISKMREV